MVVQNTHILHCEARAVAFFQQRLQFIAGTYGNLFKKIAGFSIHPVEHHHIGLDFLIHASQVQLRNHIVFHHALERAVCIIGKQHFSVRAAVEVQIRTVPFDRVHGDFFAVCEDDIARLGSLDGFGVKLFIFKERKSHDAVSFVLQVGCDKPVAEVFQADLRRVRFDCVSQCCTGSGKHQGGSEYQGHQFLCIHVASSFLYHNHCDSVFLTLTFSP